MTDSEVSGGGGNLSAGGTQKSRVPPCGTPFFCCGQPTAERAPPRSPHYTATPLRGGYVSASSGALGGMPSAHHRHPDISRYRLKNGGSRHRRQTLPFRHRGLVPPGYRHFLRCVGCPPYDSGGSRAAGSCRPHPGRRAKPGCSGILHLRQGLRKCLRHPCRRSGCRSSLTKSKRTVKRLPKVRPSICGLLRASPRTSGCLPTASQPLLEVRCGGMLIDAAVALIRTEAGFSPPPVPRWGKRASGVGGCVVFTRSRPKAKKC